VIAVEAMKSIFVNYAKKYNQKVILIRKITVR